MNKKKV